MVTLYCFTQEARRPSFRRVEFAAPATSVPRKLS
jgi:hypothetical protein